MTRPFSHREIEDLKDNYDLKSLEYWRGAARERLEDMEKNIKAFLEGVAAQIAIVQGVSFKPYVNLNRRTDYYGKVQFEVSLHQVPRVDIPGTNTETILQGQRINHPSSDLKRFPGTERRDAIRYAEELAKEHSAEIIKTGWGWK